MKTPAKAAKQIGTELGRTDPKGTARLAVALAKRNGIKVEGQDGAWELDSERATTDPRQVADYAARGWRGVGSVRRVSGRRQYTALISTDGTFASIIR